MRKGILFGGVAVLLAIGLVLGIIWAKQRSATVASSHEATKQEVATDNKSAGEEAAPQSQAQQPTSVSTPSSAPTQHSSHQPAQVPATGATSITASLFGYIAVAVATSWYMRTRKRLLTTR